MMFLAFVPRANVKTGDITLYGVAIMVLLILWFLHEIEKYSWMLTVMIVHVSVFFVV